MKAIRDFLKIFKKEEVKIPESLFDAIIYFKNFFDKERDFVNWCGMEEDKAVTSSHHGTGRWIRNNWGFWKQEGELYNFFLKKGLSHPDDMSSVILTSLHRHMNGKDLDIPGQVKHYIDFWEKQKNK